MMSVTEETNVAEGRPVNDYVPKSAPAVEDPLEEGEWEHEGFIGGTFPGVTEEVEEFVRAKKFLKTKLYEKAIAHFTKALPEEIRSLSQIEPVDIADYFAGLEERNERWEKSGGVMLSFDDIRKNPLRKFDCSLSMIFMGRGRVWQLLKQHAKAVKDYTHALRASAEEEGYLDELSENFCRYPHNLPLVAEFFTDTAPVAANVLSQEDKEDVEEPPQENADIVTEEADPSAAKEFPLEFDYIDVKSRIRKKRARIFILRASSYVSLQRCDLALRNYESALKLNPDDIGIYTGKAHLYMIAGQYEPAFRQCTEALTRNKRSSVVYEHIGMIYAQTGNITHAITSFSRALSLKPNYEGFILRGKAHFSRGDREKALEDFTLAIEHSPTLPLAYGNRAALYAQLGRFEEAIADATRWIQHSPHATTSKECISAFQARGVWCAQLGRYKQAVRDFTQVIKLDERHILAYSSRATAYGHLRLHNLSIADWLAVAQLHPQWPKSFWSIGEQYMALRNYNIAIKFFSEAINLEPKNVMSYRQRAAAYSALQIHDKAHIDLSIAIQLSPQTAVLYQARSYESFRMKNFVSAIKDLNMAMYLNPTDATNYEKRAAIFFQMGRNKFGRTDLICARKVKEEVLEQERKAKENAELRAAQEANAENGVAAAETTLEATVREIEQELNTNDRVESVAGEPVQAIVMRGADQS